VISRNLAALLDLGDGVELVGGSHFAAGENFKDSIVLKAYTTCVIVPVVVKEKVCFDAQENSRELYGLLP
jgi:hypothetical protein